MTLPKSALLLPLLAGLIAGCGDGFPDEEMHLGLDDKVRPYAVLIEPPEASPGDTVQVTLRARAPHPDELDITWRVALDYSLGLYGVDEVERNLRPLAPPPPVADADGFLTQTFAWVVPDSALLTSSALPAIVEDPSLATLGGLLAGAGFGLPPRKDEVDAWLRTLDADEVRAMDPATRLATRGLADRFACAVRFRATLRTDVVVDVTRNLTIRHTRRLEGPNLNHNPRLLYWNLAAVEKRDAEESDLSDPALTVHRLLFLDVNGERVADVISVPFHDDWTYYLTSSTWREDYTSPWNPEFVASELARYRWYYYRQDAPTSAHQFFVTDEGDEAEMWNLTGSVRIMPDGVGSTFRVVAVVRDYRDEWESFQASPGTALAEGVVTFTSP